GTRKRGRLTLSSKVGLQCKRQHPRRMNSVKAETFIASDMRTAMAQVRLALGNDAVILSSRRVGDQTEIRAARETVETDTPRPLQSSPAETAAPDVAPVIQSIQDELGRLR